MDGRRLSVEEIAEDLGISKDTVCIWATPGMPGHKIGWLWKLQKAEVDEWVHGGGPATKPKSGKEPS